MQHISAVFCRDVVGGGPSPPPRESDPLLILLYVILYPAILCNIFRSVFVEMLRANFGLYTAIRSIPCFTLLSLIIPSTLPVLYCFYTTRNSELCRPRWRIVSLDAILAKFFRVGLEFFSDDLSIVCVFKYPADRHSASFYFLLEIFPPSVVFFFHLTEHVVCE